MSGSGLTLRRASPGDVEAVTELQHAAYAANRPLLGVEPIPLLADYAQILAEEEVWLAELDGTLAGVLVLTLRPEDLLIWSIAAHPAQQKQGVANRMLAFAEERAREEGRGVIRLYTGQKLPRNVDWYARHGYEIERLEQLDDRTLVHMSKTLA